jgi:gluconolactonase
MRSFTRVIVIAIFVVFSLQAISYAQVAPSMKVLRLAPALDALIAPGVEPEVVSGGYVFTEGPMWRGGRLWFSDEEGDKIHAVTPDGQDTVLIDFTRGPYARPDRQKTGPNAMATSKDGSVVLCEQYNRAIARLVGQHGHLRAVAFFDSYQGKHLNSPNDLVFLPDGSFFFTDPPYGLKGRDHDPAKQLSFNGVFHYKVGKLTPIITNLILPNGIALSPDNKTLYVNNSGPKERVIAYPLRADGTVGPPRDVIDFTGKEGPGVPDGIKTDSRGNIWTTGPGGIRILTPAGKVLGQILLPEVAANLAWGGDGSTLYITARTHVYRLQTLVQGQLPAFRR